MYKEYKLNQYESVDFELNDAGTDNFDIRLDSVLSFLIADLELYSDSDRLVPLSASDWEYYATDSYYTALEAETDGSEKTIYSEIRILNATYQTGTIYATCNNFGSYTSGQANGVDFYTITEDTTYTILPEIKEAVLLIPSSVTTQLTITLEQGTHPCGNASTLNRCRVVDESSYDGYHIISDGEASPLLHWIEDQSVEFIYNSSDVLSWASAGWGKAYKDYDNDASVDWADVLRGTSTTLPDGLYRALCCASNPETGTNGAFTMEAEYKSTLGADALSPTGSISNTTRFTIDIGANTIYCSDSPDVRELWLWHDAK